MENENKELELESQDIDGTVDEAEFDPANSEEFYSNLEAAIGGEEETEPEELPELILSDDIFGGVEEKYEENASPGEEEMFAGVDAALAEQIAQEFGIETEISSTEEKTPNKAVALWRSVPNWTKVLVGCILALLISVGLLFGTAGGRKLVLKMIVGIAFDWAKEDPDETEDPVTPVPGITATGIPDNQENQGNQDVTPEPTADPEITPGQNETPTVTPGPTATPNPAIQIMDDENIINVLLIGEENVYGAKRGRADAVLVVSIDLNGGPLKLISFQRDLYVAIPGYSDDKLNAAYAYGGAKLIVQTIEQNFGIDIDSYVKVGFEGFENIIDKLGGLRLSLTARESEYLNTTKYISKPSERNTIAGYQTMTGSQVLGYCRVRYVPTAEGLTNDRGRNYRHRVVLQAIFNQYKDKSFAELATVMRQCFDYVTVPSDLEELAVDCLHAVIENKMFEIETMQMPVSKLYTSTNIGGKDVIIAHLESIDKLQEFLYGED